MQRPEATEKILIQAPSVRSRTSRRVNFSQMFGSNINKIIIYAGPYDQGGGGSLLRVIDEFNELLLHAMNPNNKD
uniref:Uncharacterized protein n=1 Tax=Romanomermis culicivorax TaxID=13658 RepID=A0A915HT77_ROMCU